MVKRMDEMSISKETKNAYYTKTKGRQNLDGAHGTHHRFDIYCTKHTNTTVITPSKKKTNCCLENKTKEHVLSIFCTFFFIESDDDQIFVTKNWKKKMTLNHQNDFESSDDSDESEYCAHSTINPKWQRDYESGSFGADFPIQSQKKVDEPKSVNLSKEFLTKVLDAVRHKQNTQKQTESSAAQDAITAIIGTNANVTQETTQTNGGGVGQTPPANNQSANLCKVNILLRVLISLLKFY